MAIIRDEIAQQVKDKFVRLVNPVRLAVFSQALVDPGSEDVKRLVEEVAELDPRITVEAVNFVLDTERVEALAIKRTPAIAFLGDGKDYGVRFYGLPSNYEFQTLIDAIVDVSSGESGLAKETRAALAELKAPVHLQVFSTPT